ncbi:MAG TPA: hypothetical protein VFN59_09280 [Acidimicrobiales bacterium]|nr:hypothetical protein [Acidimicrobiales bacterium]
MHPGAPRSSLARRPGVIGLAILALACAGAVPLATAVAASAAGSPAYAHACATPALGWASCGAIQLLDPAANWHPGPGAHKGSGGGSSTTTLPSSGYLPGDLLSAYSLTSAAQTMTPGSSAPTIAIVDAYNDPYAAQDLATYRANLSNTTDSQTGISDIPIPPLCSSSVTSGCVTFTQVSQTGSTSLPRSNSSWSEEISLDLDMASAICPACNLTLVEASSASFSNLQAAENYAKSLKPAVVTNSYGGGEFSSETSDNATYSATTTTAITVSSGDSGYGTEFPAAAPNVTAVGGTSLTGSSSSGTWQWNLQSVWSSAGSGCSAYEPLPSWQNDPGVYNDSSLCAGRQVADVSAVADPNTGVAVYDTYGLSGWTVFGGTSASAQIVGATYALAAASGGSTNTSPQALYVDAETSAKGSTLGLTPVTSGYNASCGNYLCDASRSLSSGYNGPAGLGTFSGLGALTSSTTSSGGSTGDFSISVSPSSGSVTAGSNTNFTVTVTPSGGYTGTVVLSASSSPSGLGTSWSTPSLNFSSSSTVSQTATLSVTAPSSTSGAYTITVTGTDSTDSLTHSTSVAVEVTTASLSTMTVKVTTGTLVHKGSYRMPLTVAVTGPSGPIVGAAVTLDVYLGSGCSGPVVASTTGTTGSSGTASFTFTTKQTGNWDACASVTAPGYYPGSGSVQFST